MEQQGASVPTKKIVILRGVSGSGKSTLAQSLISQNGSGIVAEADMFFINQEGQYNFNPKQLGEAHEWCSNKVLEAMKDDSTSLIIVSNTSSQYWEMYKYVKLAKEHNFSIEFLEPTTPWKYDAKVLAGKNQHSVPIMSIQNQLNNLMENPTTENSVMVQSVLATGGYRPSLFLSGFNETRWKAPYFGVTHSEIQTYLDQLENLLGEKYEPIVNKKWLQEGKLNNKGELIYYTYLNHSKDKDSLSHDQKDAYNGAIKGLTSTPVYQGLRRAQKGSDHVYFIDIEWEEVNDVRSQFNLPPLGLYMVLGFNNYLFENFVKEACELLA
eukprot:TRINITY_DN1933_c0_g1_i2.p1 TRINITY_DN1933_c0_g1~~TRINITY_DN1933_c0_g1_i2.p1  ORF type:complete len:325 (-),score=53.07 TRINITY_DN1933_c0_g1_i2:64-1038(-)